MSSDAVLRIDSSPGAADRVCSSLSDLPAATDVNLGALSSSLAFQVRKAQLALQRRGLRSISAKHVGPAEFGALVLCEQNPGMAQFQIAAALDIDKASVVAIVDRLEELGWLLRRRSNHDRRRYGLYLTAEGARQAHVLRTQAKEAEAFAQGIFSPDELIQLLTLLARLG
ncbi:MAG: MarR family winged helix-turn-helix transcriptional regulator [Steroidobacteraceae bacterium]